MCFAHSCRAFFWGSILALWGTAGTVLSIKRGLGVERPEDVSPVCRQLAIVMIFVYCWQLNAQRPSCRQVLSCWNSTLGRLMVAEVMLDVAEIRRSASRSGCCSSECKDGRSLPNAFQSSLTPQLLGSSFHCHAGGCGHCEADQQHAPPGRRAGAQHHPEQQPGGALCCSQGRRAARVHQAHARHVSVSRSDGRLAAKQADALPRLPRAASACGQVCTGTSDRGSRSQHTIQCTT
jgi:hypothetical protein